MSIMTYITQEATRSLSGMTLDVTHWPFMESQYRWTSYNRVGPWMPTPEEALDAYKAESDKNYISS